MKKLNFKIWSGTNWLSASLGTDNNATSGTIATREWVEEQGFADSDALEGKLDKITTKGGTLLYTVLSDGSQGTRRICDAPVSGNNQWQVPVYFPQDYVENQSSSNINKLPTGGTLYVIEPKYRGQAANKAYIDDNFVPNYTGATTGTNRLYGTNPTNQNTTFIASYSPRSGAIPIYDGAGTLSTNMPTEVYHVASKKYVDDAVANVKLYRHNISIINGSNATVGYFNVSFEVISSKVIAYASIIELMTSLNVSNKYFVGSYGYGGEYGIVRVILSYDTIFNSRGFGIDGVVSNGTTAIAKRINTSDESVINSFMFMDTVTEA